MTSTTSTEPATAPAAIAAAAQPAPAVQPSETNRHAQPSADRGPAIIGAGVGDVLHQALRQERAALLDHRSGLEEELREIERGMQAIGRRLDHVQALLDEPVVDGSGGREAGAA